MWIKLRSYSAKTVPLNSNFYLAHIAIVFARYFGSTQFGHYSIGQQLYSHTVGTKFIAILRDPSRRLISWHSMKISFKSHGLWKNIDFYMNESKNNMVVADLRDLIIHRTNEVDDTLIMLKYVSFLYRYGRKKNGPWANVWLSPYMLLFAMDYPMLLIWIYTYKQMNLLHHFRVIGFNYMIAHFEEVMIRIKCWVEDGITEQMECNRMSSTYTLNESVVLEHMNTYATKKSDTVLNFLHEFYEPIKVATSRLVQETGVVLHVWNNSDVVMSW